MYRVVFTDIDSVSEFIAKILCHDITSLLLQRRTKWTIPPPPSSDQVNNLPSQTILAICSWSVLKPAT